MALGWSPAGWKGVWRSKSARAIGLTITLFSGFVRVPVAVRRPAIFWWALFAFLCFLMIVIGIESALHFLGPAIDGPFQLYNALRRIWVGQRGGADFQFFHGLAIPYLHYLQFRLLGGTFIASELARQMTSVLLYPLVVIVF